MDCKGNHVKTSRREYIGQFYREVTQLPNLIEIQSISYEKFLQKKRLLNKEQLLVEGLEEVFRSTFPMNSINGELTIEYDSYSLDFSAVRFNEAECRRLAQTYAVPLRAKVGLIFHNTGEIRQKNIYMGDLPMMTDRGTFIINGIERVVVSQIHRSPGVIFNYAKGIYSSRLIPYRGSWLEFEIDQKRELIYAKIDRKKKILATVLLRALGINTREKILQTFHAVKQEKILQKKDLSSLAGCYFAAPVMVNNDEGNSTCLYRAGDRIHLHDVDALRHAKVRNIQVIDFKAEGSLDSRVLLNCLERETCYGELADNGDTMGQAEALAQVFAVLQPGDVMVPEVAERELADIFFSSKRYDLGRVGRYKLNKKFGYQPEYSEQTLVIADIIRTMDYLIQVFEGNANVDDVDHLGNRRIRSVGELLFNGLRTAFMRMERIARERMSARENETLNPQDLISIKPVVTAVKEFFSGSQLSQFMEQVNPLAELTHKRRLNALGPGGLSRERAGFEVRDVHYSHYGRMCPIETPEGPNIGLIMSLANYARINDFGFLETPYRKVFNGRVSDDVEYLSAIDEEKHYIAQASAALDDNGNFVNQLVAVRRSGDYTIISPDEVSYMDVSPRQLISTAASLIPFLEHDDANRALMGCNMQRQAVPLLFPRAPIVGTGMEGRAVYDAGVVLKARSAGVVDYVSSLKIEILLENGEHDVYPLSKFRRTNQDTCFHHRSLVRKGQQIDEGDVLADGPATDKGELALGRNLLVGFVPWNGYNYEDAVLISEKVVKEDYYTSIHIKEFTTEVRETKLGMEKLTADIPNVGQVNLRYLDSEGIISIGAKVNSGDILVGKVTPRSETDTTPEFRLLHSIFGEKARDVRDSSLKLPHGVEGTVIDTKRLKRSMGDDLSPGVDEVIKVLVATKRKLKAGDKMAGRHGNKGVVARVLPEEDMPFLEDGTPLDICLNPLGVPSRMNIGQILEVMLGYAGSKLGKTYEMPVFLSANEEQISAELEKAGLPKNSKMNVRDGESGELFKTPILVGEMYYLKLHHLVDDKMHARSTGPYSLVTQQPLGGKAQFGGQRLGEMEVWALEAYGAAHTLHELMTIKSDDMSGRSLIYESIVKGEPADIAGIPESFSVFVQELRGLALDVEIYNNTGKQLPLTERDEELLNRQAHF